MLAGDLSEFTLPDLFQLLGLTKKSGALRIAHAGAEGRVWFDDGDVCFALADDRRMPLGARLVAGGHLDAERLQALLREHRGGTAIDLANGLLAADAIEESTLEGFIREQVHDALFALLRLDQGAFQFDPNGGVTWTGPRYSGAELLEEAHRRLDEWARLAAHMPDPKSVLSVVPNPPGGSPLTIERDQWHLVALVDGKRTVAQIVDLGGKGEFATGKLLGELVESGLVETHDRAGEGALANLLAGRHALRQLEEVALGAVSTAPSPGGLRSHESDRRADEQGLEEAPRLGGRRPSWHADETVEAVGDAAAAGTQDAEDDEPRTDSVSVEGSGESADASESDDSAAKDVSDEGDDVAREDRSSANGGTPAGEADGESPKRRGQDGDASDVSEESKAGKPAPARSFDRAQVARELASLGLDDEAQGPQRIPRSKPGAEAVRSTNGNGARATADTSGAPATTPSMVPNGGNGGNVGASMAPGYGPDALGRDDDITRGLLLRLIDGVKGA